MKKSSIIILSSCMSLFLLGGCNQVKESEMNTSPKITKANMQWKTFDNQMMGFSIKLPEKSYAGGENGMAPMTLLSSYVNPNDAYITTQYFYFQRNDEPTEERNKQYLTFDFLQKNPAISAPYWHVKSIILKNNAEIEQWIKKEFGKGCRLGEQKETDQPSVVSLAIQGDGKPLDTTECPVNYGVFMRYSKITHQLIYWSIGQDINFMSNLNGDTVYDEDILKSFQFYQ